jgi:hypothetical protein
MTDSTLPVLEGVDIKGRMNVDDAVVLANIASAIRRQLPQMQRQPPKHERVCLVGGGPSLADTFETLRDLVWAGAKLVTLNGAYQWCLERNLKPSAQIVMDARESNARFVDPAVPGCQYVLASQCHPKTFDAVEGREGVWLFHAMNPDGIEQELLDTYYFKQWHGVGGGTTVGMRAIMLLRTVGYLRFDLFGLDSCFLHGQHHAYEQPENANDKPRKVTAHPSGHPELAKDFYCAPWHIKQCEDFVQFLAVNGEHVLLNIHGDGLLATVLQQKAAITVEE